MAMQWNPQPEAVNLLLNLLHASSSPETASNPQVREQLANFTKRPDTHLYLLQVLSSRQIEDHIRVCAALIMKNHIKDGKSLGQEQQLLKNEIVKILPDPIPIVRRTAGMVVSALVGVGGLKAWPGLMEFLVGCLDSPDPNLLDGALLAIEKICEDHTDDLDSESAGRPIGFLLPRLLHLFKHPTKEIRLCSLNCIAKFLNSCPNQMVINMDKFLEGFFYLANDPEISVRKRVVQALLILTESHPTVLTKHFPKVVEFMLYCMRQDNTDLALQATEFWTILASAESLCERVLTPFLPQVLPAILTRMMYTQQDLNDIGDIGENAENAHVPDKQKDVKPTFTSAQIRGGKDDADDDEEDYDEGDWNMRKYAADALDSLAQCWVSSGFLEQLLPLVEKGLKSPDWLTRECSILALGCIARGSYRDMKPYLPNLIPYMFNLLKDTRPLIRSMTCWTLGRYCKWIFGEPDKDKYANRLMAELLTAMMDKHKTVQKQAASAVSTVIDTASDSILPYATAILSTTGTAFMFYQRSNQAFLYDIIGSLSDALGQRIKNDELLRLLLPPILTKWDSLADDDTDIFPLLECLSQVAVALGPAFGAYAKPVFGRCLKIIESVLLTSAMAQQDKSIDPPNHEFLICSLDLLSGVIEALGRSVEPFINGTNFVNILVEVCKSTHDDYKQSAFALVGDLARHYPDCLTPPVISVLIPLLINGMDPALLQACNNAVWAVGEIVMKTPAAQVLDQYAEKLLSKFFSLVAVPGDLLAGSTAVAICRIGFFRPELILPHIQPVLTSICVSLRALEDDTEKADGLRGLCSIVRGNPTVVLPQFSLFAETLGSYYDPPDELKNVIGTVLHAYKKQIPPQQWITMWNDIVDSTRNSMEATYKIC